jgi:hypothetical protein
VNCRDLNTLSVDSSRFTELAAELPVGYPRVAESGVAHPMDVQAIVASGYRLALVGTTLMSESDPCRMLERLLAAGRGAAEAERSTNCGARAADRGVRGSVSGHDRVTMECTR